MRINLRQLVVIGSIAPAMFAGCSSETPQSLLASGKNYLAKGDTKSAVIQLKNALQKDANLTEARFLLGKALLDAGDAVSAEKELRKALELGYSADQVVPLLARALVSIGKYKEVDELVDAKVSSPAAKAELMAALGEAKFATGDVNAARRAFSAALAAQPGYIPAEVGQARIVASEGDLAKAHVMADAVLARMPSYYNAWQLKGQIFAAQQQYDLALAAYHKAVQAKPDFAAGHFALVSLLIQQNKLDEAATEISVLRKIAPQQSWFLDALLKYQQKNFTKARDAVLQVLRVQPDLLSAVLLAGAIEFELESYEQAETHLSKVLQRAPGQASARRLLVLTYLRSSQPVKALEALKPAMEQGDNDPALLSLAG